MIQKVSILVYQSEIKVCQYILKRILYFVYRTAIFGYKWITNEHWPSENGILPLLKLGFWDFTPFQTGILEFQDSPYRAL